MTISSTNSNTLRRLMVSNYIVYELKPDTIVQRMISSYLFSTQTIHNLAYLDANEINSTKLIVIKEQNPPFYLIKLE